MKRTFDFLLATSLLIFLSPLLIVIWFLVLLSFGRPVLFLQQRPGFKAKPFYLYKFRTMHETKDKSGELLPDKMRISAMGSFLRKTSLDELPSLINIIKGELSFVGPRPLLMEYLPLYSPSQMRRHDVRPGLTGWAQINGRNNITWERRFELDLWYVENTSFRLDMFILLKTFVKVIRSDGVNASHQETMPKFTGTKLKDY